MTNYCEKYSKVLGDVKKRLPLLRVSLQFPAMDDDNLVDVSLMVTGANFTYWECIERELDNGRVLSINDVSDGVNHYEQFLESFVDAAKRVCRESGTSNYGKKGQGGGSVKSLGALLVERELDGTP